MNSVANDMNTTIDHDDEETIFQSSHRQWAEETPVKFRPTSERSYWQPPPGTADHV
jgi:hypothetical protein